MTPNGRPGETGFFGRWGSIRNTTNYMELPGLGSD